MLREFIAGCPLGHEEGIQRLQNLEIILAGGIALKASDIHIEPEDADVRLRYRLDGVLTDILHFDKETFELLLSRLKLVSQSQVEY
jgi:type II secretory ATPase GspE/PulE/Tfp pilus assembly ATPase PilB-like protein